MSEEENNDDWAAALDESGGDDDWAAAMNEQAESETESLEDDDWGAALEEQAAADAEDEITEDDIQSAPLEYLEDDSVGFDGDNPNLEVIMDFPVNIAMEVGSTEIAIRNLLQLNQGSVIELDRLAGRSEEHTLNSSHVRISYAV